MPPILTLTDVRKSFGGVRALGGVNLDAASRLDHRADRRERRRQIDAGEDPLRRSPAGLAATSASTARDPHRHADRRARDLGIGVVHQECLVFDHLTVAENLFINAHPRRGAAHRLAQPAHARAGRAATSSAPTSARTPRSAALSIAQKHVVQIARALVNESRVLILDEPTASLSQRECAELFRIARQLRDAGCALLFISHEFDEIFELADRYAVFRDGASVGEGELAATASRRADPADGGAPGRTTVSRSRRRTSATNCCASRTSAARANSRTSASRCGAEKFSASMAWWARAAPSSRRCCSARSAPISGTRQRRRGHRAGARGPAVPGQHPAVFHRGQHRAAQSRDAGAARLVLPRGARTSSRASG